MDLVEVLRHHTPPRKIAAVELPFGLRTLRLDLPGPVISEPDSHGMDDEAMQRALARLVEAREYLLAGEQSAGEAIILALIGDYPYFADAYRELYEFHAEQINIVEAEFYLKQWIALAPTYQSLTRLGRFLGNNSRYDEAIVVQEHLWSTRAGVPEHQVIEATNDYLITLTRLAATERLLMIAAQAIVEYGRHLNLLHHYLVGLSRAEQINLSQHQLLLLLDELDNREPLRPQLEWLVRSIADRTGG